MPSPSRSLLPLSLALLAGLGAAACSSSPEAPEPVLGGALLADNYTSLGGLAWDADGGALYFCDPGAGRLYRWRSGSPPVAVRADVGTASAVALGVDRELVVAQVEAGRLAAFDEAGRGPRVLAASFQGRALRRPRQVLVADGGPLYALDEEGRLLLRTALGDLERVGDLLDPVGGMALDPDGSHLVVSVPGRRELRRVALGPDGRAAGPSEVLATTGEDPEGVAVDVHGRIYVATRAGIELRGPDGVRQALLQQPRNARALCFGGLDGRTLFATTERELWRVHVDAPGAGLGPAQDD